MRHNRGHPRGLKRREGGHTSGCGLRDPEQQFLLPASELRISVEGSLPLSGITPSERLKLSCQRTNYKPFTPGGSAIETRMASNAAISLQHIQNDLRGGRSQYSDVEVMSVRQQSDSTSIAKCCHFDAFSLLTSPPVKASCP